MLNNLGLKLKYKNKILSNYKIKSKIYLMKIKILNKNILLVQLIKMLYK